VDCYTKLLPDPVCHSLPDTAALRCGDIGGLLHQASTGPGLPHQASASRHVESVTVLHYGVDVNSNDYISLAL